MADTEQSGVVSVTNNCYPHEGCQDNLDKRDRDRIPNPRSSFLNTTSVSKMKIILTSYYETMRNQPGMNSNDDIRIRIAEIELISLLEFVEGVILNHHWSEDEFQCIQKTEILYTLCLRIELKEFPPSPYHMMVVDRSLFPVPSSNDIQLMKHQSKSSPISRVIRDMNAVEDRKRRYFHVDKLPYGIDVLVGLLTKLLPLHIIDDFHIIMSSPGENNQALHTDFKGLQGQESMFKVMPYFMIAAFEDETYLWHHLDNETKQVKVQAGGCIFGAGNAIHAGSAYKVENLRVHVYIDSLKFKHDARSQDFAPYAHLHQPPTAPRIPSDPSQIEVLRPPCERRKRKR